MIGIRQADGSFYEIMGDAPSGPKRLILSAARTDQHGVRIDLYRSVDGTASDEGALGSITLDDPQGLGYQDIEFRVDLDAEGLLTASAQLPGQDPRTLSVDLTPFRSATGTESFGLDDLPPLEGGFDTDSETMTLDLPEAEAEAPRRSDADILGDEAFASADLDTLDDFTLEDPEGGTPETRGLDDFGAPSEFDLGDLDAGFGEGPPSPEATDSAEEWEKISLDDMEPMEFLDTGAEISAPSKVRENKTVDDVDEPLELGDFDSDLSDLPDLGDFDTPSQGSSMSPSDDNDLDQDFLAPPELTEPSPWGSDDREEEEAAAPVVTPAKASKPPKPAKASAGNPGPRAASGTGTIDKMSLFLSLAALSLLVLLILVLLFLNMIKAPQPPMIQPEVHRWTSPEALASAPAPLPGDLDLGAADPVVFEAETVLEVPRALRDARISLLLEPGESLEDAQRRFGAPAKAQGNLLFW